MCRQGRGHVVIDEARGDDASARAVGELESVPESFAAVGEFAGSVVSFGSGGEGLGDADWLAMLGDLSPERPGGGSVEMVEERLVEGLGAESDIERECPCVFVAGQVMEKVAVASEPCCALECAGRRACAEFSGDVVSRGAGSDDACDPLDKVTVPGSTDGVRRLCAMAG
jgi:hypothetical protein